ncbi:alpha/beta hydrolase fold [Halorhodospira halochloris]|uniref:Alpha/beta hydrolase fold n=1 Tax=Halorhodospira halochloris TaxID=1052 RepID=A0A0X8X815_HALHR|nr:alpha/beta hydrolase [Halorhodospira halochloris]MBK1650773.1 hypothetical protein [Halorhodospira halochloris]MCG5548860.1 alpha/beta hydrolase [Halorhodospira halochloris]BAU56732.2 alpha/beta hydrolase fold [Halorhodospira halochloris]
MTEANPNQSRKQSRLPLLGKVTLALFGSLLIAALVLPFLISTDPAEGAPPEELATEQSRFMNLTTNDNTALLIHYLHAAGEGNSYPNRTDPEKADKPATDSAAGGSHRTTPMVLLHGFTLNAYSWQEIIPHLATSREVIAYDQIPYGLSAKPALEADEDVDYFSLAAAVDHLIALLDKQEIPNSILVGNSSGGAVALAAAHSHPERIEALVLINPMATVERMTLPDWLGHSPQVKRLNLLAARWFGSSTTLLEASYHDPALISERRRELALLHTQVEGWDLAWGEIFNRALVEPLDVEQAIAEVSVPTLVVIGAEDTIIDPQESQQLAETLQNADSLVIEDCGHLPHEECPERTYEKISGWINALERAE